MESDSEEIYDDGDLVEQAYEYVVTASYPNGCPVNRKRIIRRKAKNFEVKDGELYYTKNPRGKVAIQNSMMIFHDTKLNYF